MNEEWLIAILQPVEMQHNLLHCFVLPGQPEHRTKFREHDRRVINGVNIDIREIDIMQQNSFTVSKRFVANKFIDAARRVTKLNLKFRKFPYHIGIEKPKAPRATEIIDVNSFRKMKC